MNNQDMAEGRLVIMGQITTKETDAPDYTHPMALLITFDSVDAIRKAIKDGYCRYEMGGDK